DSFSQDFFVGQLPFNTFNPGPAYNDIGFSFSPVPVLQSGQPVYTDFGVALPVREGVPDVFTVDQNLRTPYIQIYNANVQQRLGPSAAIKIGYVGPLARRLFPFRDINQPHPAVGVYPFPDYLYINQFESTATSHYNALQAVLKLRNWH